MIQAVKKQITDLYNRIKEHQRQILIFGGGGLLFILMMIQFFYPSDRLVIFTSIDGVSLSGWQKKDAIKHLDDSYAKKTIPIYFGKITTAYRAPKTGEIGLSIKNSNRINQTIYPWYLRIIPTSIFWTHFITEGANQPEHRRDASLLNAYITKELGNSCDVKPQNASLKANGKKLEVVDAQSGGTCNINDVRQILSGAKPQLSNTYRVTIPVKEISPTINDKTARQFGDSLQKKVGAGVKLTVNGADQIVPATELFSWMDFSVVNGKMVYKFSTDRAAVFLNKEVTPKVTINAGVTTVNTHNFTETSRVNGASGRGLNLVATLGSLKSYIDGSIAKAVATTVPVPPLVIYKRSYSADDVGISALIQQYSQDHTGVFGVSMIELSGLNRRASYNATKSFTTASTYKLFVAYSTLKRVEAGAWQWTDQIVSGRNLSTCFDDMIVKSDNTCAAAMLAKVGYTNITNEARALGCVGTSFLGKENIKTTPADLALFLAELKTGQMLTKQSSRDRLLNAMSRNIYRQGIPGGLPGIAVANKVGFMDNLLHDASIIYSPKGTYVLVIMTEGSSWSIIADFAKQIEKLRG